MPAPPGAAIFLTLMAFNLLSDGLRDAMKVRAGCASISPCAAACSCPRARFKVTKVTIRPKCFVIMPFEETFDGVFRTITATLTAYGIDRVRSDQSAVSEPIMDDVKKQIRNSDLVLVDLTGKNPNVYYEAGLADAWGRKWIVLAQ